MRSKVVKYVFRLLWISILISSCNLPALPDLPDPDEIIDAVDPNRRTLDVPFLVQRKDTQMLCLDGDPETGEVAWDRPHPDGASSPHRDTYCVRASITMLNRYYGGSVSQDRVSYEAFKDRVEGPERDLGHGRGIPERQILSTLAWALEVGPEEIDSFNTQMCFQDFSLCTRYIDEGRPYLLTIDSDMSVDMTLENFVKGKIFTDHAVVVVGYENADEPVGIPEVDPDTGEETGMKVINPHGPRLIVNDPGYDSEIVDGERYNPGRNRRLPLRYLIWGIARVPPSGSHGVEDEMDLARGQEREYIEPGRCAAYANRDTDGDCILDFDETERFHTDPANPDTDGDDVPDLLDLREYVYDGHSDTPDFDEDGLRKEVDPNNDDDCFLDGEEDINFNGNHDPDEQSNFEQADNCYWYGEEHVTLTATINGVGAEEQYDGYISFLETTETATTSSLSDGEDYVEFIPRTFGGNPGSIVAMNPPSPYVFGLEGFIRRTDEGRILWLKKIPPDIMPMATVHTPAGTSTVIYPNPIGIPGVWYAIDPMGVMGGSTFPEWAADYEQLSIDPQTNEVWLKLRIDDSDPDRLVARWQDNIIATETRGNATGTLNLSLDIVFWRGNEDRPE